MSFLCNSRNQKYAILHGLYLADGYDRIDDLSSISLFKVETNLYGKYPRRGYEDTESF